MGMGGTARKCRRKNGSCIHNKVSGIGGWRQRKASATQPLSALRASCWRQHIFALYLISIFFYEKSMLVLVAAVSHHGGGSFWPYTSNKPHQLLIQKFYYVQMRVGLPCNFQYLLNSYAYLIINSILQAIFEAIGITIIKK